MLLSLPTISKSSLPLMQMFIICVSVSTSSNVFSFMLFPPHCGSYLPRLSEPVKSALYAFKTSAEKLPDIIS